MTAPWSFSPIYPITPEGVSRESLRAWADALIEGGARILQYRRKSASDLERYDDLAALLERARPAGCKVIVDDRVDLCMILEADGVHLGQDDLPALEARRLLGPSKIIGVSTHSLEQALEAEDLPVDYLALGPVFPTSTKVNTDPVVPVAVQEIVLGRTRLPVVAIGGIRPEGARSLIARGFSSLAVIGALASDPSKGWREFLACMP
jgi:thiamine-phosphate diphosphorylase